MSLNYSQYLGARKCCDLKVQGPQGPQGATGPSAIGPMGYQGATGPQGYQGATGRSCLGPTGPQGPQGESQWTPMNDIAGSTGGYTGIGITGQDVLIYGNLLVTGGIDPTYLALTPQPNGPQGFINPLWIDSENGNPLRSNFIYMDNPLVNTGYISLKPDNNGSQLILSNGLTPENKTTITYSTITTNNGTYKTTINPTYLQLPNLNSYPSTVSTGAICCYLTKLYFYNGTTWQQISP